MATRHKLYDNREYDAFKALLGTLECTIVEEVWHNKFNGIRLTRKPSAFFDGMELHDFIIYITVEHKDKNHEEFNDYIVANYISSKKHLELCKDIRIGEDCHDTREYIVTELP